MIIHTQLFLAIALNSLVCLGVHVATREDMILFPFAQFIKRLSRKVGDYISPCSDFNMAYYVCKPLFDCPPCMASVWGLLGWFYLMPSLAIVPYLLVLCGVNSLISKLYYYGD
jgi:hypothetical protein